MTEIDTRNPLAVEFGHLCDLDDREDVLARWRRHEPVLAGLGSVRDLPDALAIGQPADKKDAILLALIRSAQRSETRAAAVCVLTALWPKVRAMGFRLKPDTPAVQGLSRHDMTVLLQGEMFEQILAYRTERWVRKVAGTLALNTLHAVTNRNATIEQIHIDWSHPGRDVPVTDIHGHTETSAGYERDLADGSTPTRRTEIVQTLLWAVRAGAVSRTDACLLHDVYLDTRPFNAALAAAAERANRSPAAIRQRCSRATRSIAAAIREASREPVACETAA